MEAHNFAMPTITMIRLYLADQVVALEVVAVDRWSRHACCYRSGSSMSNQQSAALPNWAVGPVLLDAVVFECGCNELDGCVAGVCLIVRTVDFGRSVVEFQFVVVAVVGVVAVVEVSVRRIPLRSTSMRVRGWFPVRRSNFRGRQLEREVQRRTAPANPEVSHNL